MKKPIRVTVALDEESYEIFNRLKDEIRVSQSELIRRVFKFYSIYRDFERYESDRIMIYAEMLAEGGAHNSRHRSLGYISEIHRNSSGK